MVRAMSGYIAPYGGAGVPSLFGSVGLGRKKRNVFQEQKWCPNEPGPKGCYEARQVNGELYVRIDIPGVPPDEVQVLTDPTARRVTFTGKAVRQWNKDLDSSAERLYTGAIILDHNDNGSATDGNEINPQNMSDSRSNSSSSGVFDGFRFIVRSGCLRMFFPGAKGCSFQFPAFVVSRPVQSSSSCGCDKEDKPTGGRAKRVRPFSTPHVNMNPCDLFLDYTLPVIGNLSLFGCVRDNKCHCGRNCLKDQKESLEDCSYNDTHINPFLVHGPEGVYEQRLVGDDDKTKTMEVHYVRLDMPGLDEKDCSFTRAMGVKISVCGNTQLECPFDEAGRRYSARFCILCSCCLLHLVCHEIDERWGAQGCLP